MLDFLKQKACDTGLSSLSGYCPPVVQDVCQGIFECYVKPHLTSIAAVATGTALVAGGVAAYMKKDAILGKSEKADDSVSSVSFAEGTKTEDSVKTTRRSSRAASINSRYGSK